SLLVTDRPLEALLGDAAAAIVESFSLTRCSIEISAGEGEPPIRASAGPGGDRTGSATVVELTSGSRAVGTLTAVRRPGTPAPSDEDERLLRAFAGQLALAADRAATEAEARRARLDAEASRLRAALF